MPKRELNIHTDNKLMTDTQEELIFKSPPPIPDYGLRSMIQMGRINGSECSYYDIAPTENQIINDNDNLTLTIFGDIEDINTTGYGFDLQEAGGRPQPIDEQDILDKFEIIMGQYSE